MIRSFNLKFFPIKKLSITLLIVILSYLSTQSQILQLKSEQITLTNSTLKFTQQKIKNTEIINDRYYRLMGFKEIPEQQTIDNLKKLDINFISYLPKNTYVVSLPVNLDKSNLLEYEINNIEKIPLTAKFHQSIFESPLPIWANDSNNVKVSITLMKDAEIEDLLNYLINKNTRILDVNKVVKIIRTSVPKLILMDIINYPSVNYVDLIPPPSKPEDILGRCLVRSNAINTHYNEGRHYDGEGVSVGLNDDGYVGPHIDFQGRTEQKSVQNDLTGDHGDMVAGILAGAGNLNPQYEGMAKGAKIHVRQYNSSLPGSVQLHNDSGVMIFSSSYGNGCNDGYTTLCRQVDQEIRLNPSLIQVFSCGNSGTQNCGYGAGSGWGTITGGHKQGKNVIATANLNYNGTLVNSSSRGPATDGRIKPDLAAHGNGQISTDPNNTYGAGSGTSAAAPGIAGVLAQLYQAYREINNENPPSALVKACMLNTAEDYGNPGPDYSFGWGRVNALRAVKTLEDKNYIDTNISQGESQSFAFQIPQGVKEARIMIYWLDYEGSASASKALVNDLDLSISDGSNNFLPWILNPTATAASISAPATNGVDHLNNMEQVTLYNPIYGTYIANINGFSIPLGPQKYYLLYEFIKDEITITYPIGGEGISPKTMEYINWDAIGNNGFFKIEYSVDSGNTWKNIGSAGGSVRMKNWYVPDIVTSNCKIRVSRENIIDESDYPFTIIDDPKNILIDSVCLCNISISWDSVPGAESYEILLLGEKYMDSIGSTINTFYNIPVNTPTQDFWYTVRAISEKGLKGKRAIAQYYDGNIQTTNCAIKTDFESNTDFMCVGSSIEINDLSTGCPTNWEWSFSPTNPTFLNGTSSFSKNPTISFNQIGNYNITLTSSNIYGSQSITKTEYIKVVDEKDIEILEDFESNTFPPSEWKLQNIEQQLNWKDTLVNGINGLQSNVMIISNSMNNNIDNNRLISFPINIANNLSNPYLFFDLAYSNFNEYNDELIIEISDDCGQSFYDTIYFKAGSNLETSSSSKYNWAPNESGDWRRESISLYNQKGKIVSIAFNFNNKSNYGNNLFIDNINVKNKVNEDYDPLSFNLYPNPNYGSFTIQMENYDIEQVNVKVIDASGKLIEDSNLNFSKSASKTIEFKNDFLAKGFYFIKISDGEFSKLKSFVVL